MRLVEKVKVGVAATAVVGTLGYGTAQAIEAMQSVQDCTSAEPSTEPEIVGMLNCAKAEPWAMFIGTTVALGLYSGSIRAIERLSSTDADTLVTPQA